MFIVITVASRLVSELLFLLSGHRQPDPSHASLLRRLSEYLPLPTYGIVYIQIPVERLPNSSSANILFGSSHKERRYRARVSRRCNLSSSLNRSTAGDRSLRSGSDSDCVEVWDSEVSFTSDGPTVRLAPDPRRPEETAYNGDDEMSVPESAADQKIASLESELGSLRSQLADILMDKEARSLIPAPPPDMPLWFRNRISEQTPFLTPVSRPQRRESRDRPNMVSVLEGLGSIKLKCVEKSPGGTPLKLTTRSPKPGDDPGAIIAYALKKRFANMLPSFNEDEEHSNSEDLDHTFSL